MNTTQPHIDEILRAFFEHELAGRRGPVTRQRITRVYQRLLECLQTEAEGILTDDDRVLLAAEREFQPVGAAARTMHANDLRVAIDRFVRKPWLDTDRQERQDVRVQLRLSRAILMFLAANQLIAPYSHALQLLTVQRAITGTKMIYQRRSQPL
ncbi:MULTISPECIES: hypothetical protein [unclassified Cryobacterium]|uniref:hypothetical protein n=1 Tax=unclassified Cryobacterium TaxID=2649013 RepID=UPI002AB40DEB|nr:MULTISPECIES: hypothetical protein [unclassified Cryobacterium]MDY7542062.1 hypothetical protein [Cryobacterium sp. 5B3]MEB0266812.1 hypothetical protein [Cryobacterium sp. 10I5]MEB0276404.1 hypothetical protein [Cryobacterium sp. 5B3]